MDLRIFQVDAFTRVRFTGNPATVILDADGQSDDTLAAIAREFAHAEVAFVCAATAADHDLRLRFFNSRHEAPFVGHATIAAHAVLLAIGRRSAGACRQLSGTGIIEVSARDEAGVKIEFRQSVPELDAPLPLKTTLRVAEALRLPGTQLHEAMPARVARKGSSRLLVPVAHADALDGLKPNDATLLALGHEFGVEGFFVFSTKRGAAGMSTDARMFCPALGIPEDPVSGNAHAMLAAYLWSAGVLDERSTGFVGRQGRYVDRAGEVKVALEVEHGSLRAVHIGGSAVIVSEGTLAPS
jgi:PhzF family phenazine biosynthesis protein